MNILVGAGVRLLVLPILVLFLVGSFWVMPLVAPGVCDNEAGIEARFPAMTGGDWLGWTGACE